MVELVHGRRYGEVCLCSTKEIELMRVTGANGRRVWVLDIAAYGQWWCETFSRKTDAYRYLQDRWRISQAFWRTPVHVPLAGNRIVLAHQDAVMRPTQFVTQRVTNRK